MSCWFSPLFCFSGYICERKDLLVNGCCNVNVPSTKLYSCDSCLPNGCCSVYEYCVSCCLQPSKVRWLSPALQVFSAAWVPLGLKVLVCEELFPERGQFLFLEGWGKPARTIWQVLNKALKKFILPTFERKYWESCKMLELQGNCICWREEIAEELLQPVSVLQLPLPCIL